MFGATDTLPVVLFGVLAVAEELGDNILKPILLWRGEGAPMQVVLLGAIDGLIASGVEGLFVGAVIFTLGFKNFLVWLGDNSSLNERGSQ